MGISSRDYIRNDVRGPLARSDASAIPWIIGACVVVFVANGLSQGQVNRWLRLDFDDFGPRLQLWRIVTYGFCHGGSSHILFNMISLWLFGKFVEPIYGAREFLAFYLVAIVLSGIGFLAIDAGLAPLIPAEFRPRLGAVGASGGVMAVTIVAAMLYPRSQILFMMVIPMELRVMAVLQVVLDLVGAFDGGSSIAHGAHLAGAAFGFVYQRNNWRILNGLPRFSVPKLRRRPAVKLYRPPEEREPEQVSAERVDALLQKIHEHGEASLTDEERAVMNAASKQAARRRQQQQQSL